MTHLNNSSEGVVSAILSAAFFGLIPLFTVPVLAAGMNIPNALIYRFTFGCLAMLAILVVRRIHLHISFGDSLRIASLSLLYVISAVTLFRGYHYMPSGIATTLLFSYPVWTEILLMAFFHERLTLKIATAILLAVGGVFLLCGFTSKEGISSVLGIVYEMTAGLTYAIYMVAFPKMRIRKMPSLKVTFYVFFYALLFLLVYVMGTEGHIQPITSGKVCLQLVLLGLLPTAVSNILVIKALKLISSTMVAILGAFEPLTAMLVGIVAFGEPLTIPIVIGFALIITSVVILVLKKPSK